MVKEAANNTDRLETLSRGLALLSHFGAGHAEMSIQEAAEHLGISRGAARRFLITLADEGYLTRHKRLFRINPKVLDLGYRYFASLDLPAIAKPVLQELAERTGETCILNILHGADIIILDAISTSQGLTFQPRRGTVLPGYATAAGRVIMADLADDDLEKLLSGIEFRPLTPFTVKTIPALRKAILQARDQGFAVAVNELAYGMIGVALPIRNADGRSVASVNISLQRGGTPEAMIEVCLPALTQAVNEINATLKMLG